MNKIFRAALLAAVAASAMSAACAADLPRRSAPMADYAPAPLFTWTGFYVGLNAGAGVGSFSSGSNQLFGNPSGVMGGVTAGFNYQAAPNFVLGIEGDVDATSLRSSSSLPFFGFSGTGHVSSLSTIRGRAGYSMDRTLFYVTGGLAMVSMDANLNDWRSIPFFGSQSSFQAGYTLGGGIEYAFLNNLSAKVEYLYTSTSSRDYFAGTPDWSRLGANFSTVRAGIAYHF